MDLNGVMIKSWVYKKTLFYLLKIKGQNEPVVVSARDLKSFSIRNDGSVKGQIDYNKFKISSGSSKQYFGNKKTMAEVNKDTTFDEYDPYNDESYGESPDDVMELAGWEQTNNPPPAAGGVDPSLEPPETNPAWNPPRIVLPPPPVPPPPSVSNTAPIQKIYDAEADI